MNTNPFSNLEFLVIDFETTTPKGLPPEPIEIGILKLRFSEPIDFTVTYSSLICRPEYAPITPFDTSQTGIQPRDCLRAPMVGEVLGNAANWCGDGPIAFVAQNARYEASILKRLGSDHNGFKKPFIDTVNLAKAVSPGMPSYRLDTIASILGLPIPPNRHRAMPDVVLTANVFLKLVDIGIQKRLLSCTADLFRLGGILLGSEVKTPNDPQLPLF